MQETIKIQQETIKTQQAALNSQKLAERYVQLAHQDDKNQLIHLKCLLEALMHRCCQQISPQ